MRGHARPDYGYFAGKTPFRRHIANSRPEVRQWPLTDASISEEYIARVEEQTGPEFELTLHTKMLTRHEISEVLKTMNHGRKKRERLEYYVFLERLKIEHCIPALRDFMQGHYPTMRGALRARLIGEGLLMPGEAEVEI